MIVAQVFSDEHGRRHDLRRDGRVALPRLRHPQAQVRFAPLVRGERVRKMFVLEPAYGAGNENMVDGHRVVGPVAGADRHRRRRALAVHGDNGRHGLGAALGETGRAQVVVVLVARLEAARGHVVCPVLAQVGTESRLDGPTHVPRPGALHTVLAQRLCHQAAERWSSLHAYGAKSGTTAAVVPDVDLA